MQGFYISLKTCRYYNNYYYTCIIIIIIITTHLNDYYLVYDAKGCIHSAYR